MFEISQELKVVVVKIEEWKVEIVRMEELECKVREERYKCGGWMVC